MSLENIQLPPFLIPELFKRNLVTLNINEGEDKNSNIAVFKYLGGNNRKIVLIVQNKAAIYLSDAQLKFVTGILDACKLNIGDIALVNIEKYSFLTHKEITEQLDPKIILLFGVSPTQLKLPFTIPEFQNQSFNNQLYLSIPALEILQADKELKRKLWTSLQQIFSL